jgi:acyl-CoA thioesterase-1
MQSFFHRIRPRAYGAWRRIGNLGFAAIFIGSVAVAEPVTIVALGDSLTQGYGLPAEDGFVPQLQAWLKANGTDATVINAGVSGDTTAGGLARTDWSLTPDTSALVVALGGNDLLRGIQPEVSRANIKGILEKAHTRGLPVLLVPMSAPGNYGADYKKAFDAIYPDLAKQYDALLAGNFLAPILSAVEAGTPMDDLVQPDGLHPNAKGVALVVAALGPNVLDLIKRVP